MSFQSRLKNFAKQGSLATGWYWICKSSQVPVGKAVPGTLLDQEFVIYRGKDKQIRIMDAHCPHMGAHLCDGSVEGNDIRCPFHFWKFDPSGVCNEIPAQSDCKFVRPLNTYPAQEKYGLVWVWRGSPQIDEEVPVVPELVGRDFDFSHGNFFEKNCHPNVVMINAIDAQHFKSVHNLVVDLDMKPTILSKRCIQLSNQTPLPEKNLFLKLVSKFYKTSLTYEMTYWWGHVGTVMVGPDFLHCYIMFALRPSKNGGTEGATVLITPKRRFGSILNPIILFLTKLVGNYFAKGDTIIFSRIKFSFQTPIRADKAIIDFVEHYESQFTSDSKFKSQDTRWIEPNTPIN